MDLLAHICKRLAYKYWFEILAGYIEAWENETRE